MTITGDKATAGGGVVNRGVLTLSDCVISENESEGSPGGAASSTVPAAQCRSTL